MTSIPPQPIPYYAATLDRPFRGRKAMSVVFGVFTIIFGSLSGCLGIFMPFSVMATPRPPSSAPVHYLATMLVGALFYLGAAAGLIWLGIAAIQPRRWVRPIILTLGMLSIFGGLVGCFLLCLAGPQLRDAMSASASTTSTGTRSSSSTIMLSPIPAPAPSTPVPDTLAPGTPGPGTLPAGGPMRWQPAPSSPPLSTPGTLRTTPSKPRLGPSGLPARAPGLAAPRVIMPPPAFFTGILVGMVVFFVLFFVMLPAAYVLFYRSAQVKLMLEYYDPISRWTDSIPTPVTGLVITLLLTAAMSLFALATATTNLLGATFNGPPAIAIILVHSLLLLALAYFVFRRRVAAWWGTLAYVAFVTANAVLLYARPMETPNPIPQHLLMIIPAITSLAALGYLLAIRKYFGAAAQSPPPGDGAFPPGKSP